MDRYGSEIQASKMFNFYFWRFKSENLVIIITPTTKGREEVTTVIFFRGGGPRLKTNITRDKSYDSTFFY